MEGSSLMPTRSDSPANIVAYWWEAEKDDKKAGLNDLTVKKVGYSFIQ